MVWAGETNFCSGYPRFFRQAWRSAGCPVSRDSRDGTAFPPPLSRVARACLGSPAKREYWSAKICSIVFNVLSTILLLGKRSRGLSGIFSGSSRSRWTRRIRHDGSLLRVSEPHQSAAWRTGTAEADCDVTARGVGRVEVIKYRPWEWNRGSGKNPAYDLCTFNDFSGTRKIQEGNYFVSLIFDHLCFNQSALSSFYRLLKI